MTTTLNVMLPGFGRYIGAHIGTFSTTTTIAADNSVVSTDLRDAGFTDDDVLNDTFIRIKGTQNDGTIRRISDFTGSSGTLTVAGTVLAAEAASVDFELYRYDPNQLIDALNDAREVAFPSLHQVVIDRKHTPADDQFRYARPSSIRPKYVRQVWIEPRLAAATWGNNIVGDLDCDFEGALTDWTTTGGTLTAEAETTSPDNYMVYAGQQSGKYVVTVSSAFSSYLSAASPTAYDGEEISVGIWVYSKTASRITAAILVDSGTATTGTAHSGSGWERLTVSANIGDVATSLEVGVTVSSGAAFVFYADELIAVAGPSEVPQPRGQRVGLWRGEGANIVLRERLPNDRNLAIVGCGLLSSVSDGTDTMEVDGEQLRRLYALSAVEFFQGDIDQLADTDMNAAQRRWRHYQNRVDEGQGAMTLPAIYRVPA